jgi:hypothetical protein
MVGDRVLYREAVTGLGQSPLTAFLIPDALGALGANCAPLHVINAVFLV